MAFRLKSMKTQRPAPTTRFGTRGIFTKKPVTREQFLRKARDNAGYLLGVVDSKIKSKIDQQGRVLMEVNSNQGNRIFLDCGVENGQIKSIKLMPKSEFEENSKKRAVFHASF